MGKPWTSITYQWIPVNIKALCQITFFIAA